MPQFLLPRTSYLDHSRSQTAACRRERRERIGINQEHMIAAPLCSSVILPVASLFESQSSDSFVQCTKIHRVMQVDRSCTLRPSTENHIQRKKLCSYTESAPTSLHCADQHHKTRNNKWEYLLVLFQTEHDRRIFIDFQPFFIEECAGVEFSRGTTVYAYSRV
jgi:hypothetical protein